MDNNIRKYREFLGVGQESLATATSVTRQTIAAWEKGARSISMLNLCQVAKGLGVSPWLLIRDEPVTIVSKDDMALLVEVALKAEAITQSKAKELLGQ